MKRTFYILSILVLLGSCKKKTVCEVPEMDCTNVRCMAQLNILEFRLVDAQNGNDLVFGSAPVYQVDDVKLYNDEARTQEITLAPDQNRRSFIANSGTTSMYLVLKGNQVHKLNADYRFKDCCSNQVTVLKMDNKPVCTCCGDIIQLTLN